MYDFTPPPDVAAAAQQRGLGDAVAARTSTHPLLKALYSVIAAALLFGVTWLAGSIGMRMGFRAGEKLFGFAGLAACVFGVAFVVYAVVALVRGSRSYYLWSDGFVYRHNSRIRAHHWNEVTEVRAVRYTVGEFAGEVYQYELVTGDGKPVTLTLESVTGDPFVSLLVAEAVVHNRPLT